ncbi:unnamed protein product [Paramecium octaurelia]|uniref:Tetratricopeptide repeat protein n=1 Tax=Paramecium octaurelia TaxID=43137 RepID=A0A8S1YLQ7_PAROT|nr:unnamed protein product [Paramecium octaurelia]
MIQPISINHKEEKVWYDKGSALADINQFQEAIQCFNEGTSINPKYDLALISKGNALTKLEQYQDAINCYTEAIYINPKSETAWSGKECALGSLYQFNEAIECFKQAISINPKFADAWNWKEKLNQYQEAIECYNEAISVNLNLILFGRIRQLNVTIAINPKSDQCWNNEGNALRNQNNIKKQLNITTKQQLLTLNQISVGIIRGMHQEVQNNMKMQLNVTMKQQLLILNLILFGRIRVKHHQFILFYMVLYDLNQYEQAIACYDRATSINPKFDGAFVDKGLILQKQQKNMDALTIFDQALKINPTAHRLGYKAYSLFSQEQFLDIIELLQKLNTFILLHRKWVWVRMLIQKGNYQSYEALSYSYIK